jgi:lipopolysaccharide biosynthesis glycosyltransferase
MHVALAADRAYLPWCATAILSCLEANRLDHVHAHVLHLGDLQAPDVSRLAAMVSDREAQIEVHSIDPARLARLPSKGAVLGGHISWPTLWPVSVG